MEIHEFDKKTEVTSIYDLLEELRSFDDKEVSIMIKEEFPVVEKGREVGDTSGE